MQNIENQEQETNQAELSDKYEDQYERLDSAMVRLFKYESLLNNEYLIRKFIVDPYNPGFFLLQYEVVQRENSIKSQYVQNQNNPRKQYHLILTKILQTHNGVLWHYDNSTLTIRPYFPKERKRIQIKVLEELKENVLKEVNDKTTNQEYQVETIPYAADQRYIKLYITAGNEPAAHQLFQRIIKKKDSLRLDSVMMSEVDYLDEFHAQLHQKKLQMYYAKQKGPYDQQQRSESPQSQGYGRGQQRTGGGGKPFYKQPSQQPYYVQKSHQAQPAGLAPENYQLVRKSSINQTPKQSFKSPNMTALDFPALEEQKQR